MFHLYLNNNVLLGNFYEMKDVSILIDRVKLLLLSKLEKDEIYSLLISLVYIKDGIKCGTSPIKSINIIIYQNPY